MDNRVAARRRGRVMQLLAFTRESQLAGLSFIADIPVYYFMTVAILVVDWVLGGGRGVVA